MAELTMVRIQKDVLKKIKIEAAKESVTLQAWVNRALTQALKNKNK